jgi:hypothetical protein
MVYRSGSQRLFIYFEDEKVVAAPNGSWSMVDTDLLSHDPSDQYPSDQ